MDESERAAELKRLWSSPIGVVLETALIDPPIRVMDGPSFASQYEEIFLREIYDFRPAHESPTIIDGGANVGVAVIWWRAKWPDARIVAFEPDPVVFDALVWNTRFHQGLDLRQVALSTDALGSSFNRQGTDGGSLLDIASITDRCDVKTTSLSAVLAAEGEVDLLKLDIEGAEADVLRESEPDLWRAHHIFVEYHSIAKRPQELGELLDLFSRLGYRYIVQTEIEVQRPLVQLGKASGMDFQCDVFASRVGD
jgi:FkbM family methyltransferase